MLLRSMATSAVETAVTFDMENCLGELVAAKFIGLNLAEKDLFQINLELPTNPSNMDLYWGLPVAPSCCAPWLQRQLKQPLHWLWKTVWGVGSSQIYLAEKSLFQINLELPTNPSNMDLYWGLPVAPSCCAPWLHRQLKQPLHLIWKTVWGVGSSQIYLAEKALFQINLELPTNPSNMDLYWGLPVTPCCSAPWLQRQLKQPLHLIWKTVWGVGSS